MPLIPVAEMEEVGNADDQAFAPTVYGRAHDPVSSDYFDDLEVTPAKQVVWALSSWNDPDLGPATSIQLLDEPGAPEAQER